MKTKAVILFLLVALLLLSTMACGGGGEPTATPTLGLTPTPTLTPPPTPTPAPTPGATTYFPEIPRISVEDVKAKLDAGANIAIIDTRLKYEYERTHIAGAISIPEKEIIPEPPLEEIARRYSKLRGYDEVITYCT
jgi:3-mercaptopyruvate sulfurtransferase SseA